MAAAEMARWTSSVSSIASSDTGTDADDEVDDDDDIDYFLAAVKLPPDLCTIYNLIVILSPMQLIHDVCG